MNQKKMAGLTVGNPFLGFASLLTLLIVSALVSYRNVQSILWNNAWVDHSYQVLRQIDRIEAHLVSAESATRGYVLTGLPELATEARAESAKTILGLDSLAKRVTDNGGQERRLVHLKSIVDRRLSLFGSAIETRRVHGFALPRRGPSLTAALALRAQINSELEQFRLEEEGLRVVRAEGTSKIVTMAATSFCILSLMGVIALVGFYAMVSRLHETEQALRRIEADRSAELAREVDRRTAALTAANRELSAFSYSVSHDLKGPLRAIGGFARIVQDDLNGKIPEATQSLLDRIIANCVRMREIIECFVRLARLSEGEVCVEEVDLSALCQKAVLQMMTDDPSTHLQVSIEPDLQVSGDRRMLGVVLTNLLTNAQKFTSHEENPTVHIGKCLSQKGPAFFVKDNGIGFDPSKAEQIFEPFKRLHSVGEYPGNGIGLATCEKIVSRHGGQIWAESGPGHGATILFTLPEAHPGENPVQVEHHDAFGRLKHSA